MAMAKIRSSVFSVSYHQIYIRLKNALSDGENAAEPYVIGGEVPKYSNVCEVAYVTGCV